MQLPPDIMLLRIAGRVPLHNRKLWQYNATSISVCIYPFVPQTRLFLFDLEVGQQNGRAHVFAKEVQRRKDMVWERDNMASFIAVNVEV